MSTSESMTMSPLDFTFTVITNHVLFPIDLRDVRPVLARNGYQLVPVSEAILSKPARITGSGTIATKNEFVVNVNTDLKLLGLSGKSSERIIEAFNELIAILEKEMDVDLSSAARYYEIVGHYNIYTQKKPNVQFSRVSEKIDLFGKIQEVLRTPIQCFGLRLIPKSAIPNEIEWFDIVIEPEVLQPNKYFCGLLFRSKERALVENWTLNDKELFKKLIEVIESE